MPLSIGGGAAAGLESILEEQFKKAVEAQRAKEALMALDQGQQRITNQSSQFGQTFGLERDKFAEDLVNNKVDRTVKQGTLSIAKRGADRADRAQKFDESVDTARIGLEGAKFGYGVQESDTDREWRSKENALDRDTTIKATGMRQAGSGALSLNQERMAIDQLGRAWSQAAGNAAEINRQVNNMDLGLEAARRGDMAAGSQAVLVTFQKILDPTSVVRESEYARSAAGQSAMNQARGFVERVTTGGAGVPLQELEAFAKLAREMANSANDGLSGRRAVLERRAQRFGIEPSLIFDDQVPSQEDGGDSDAPAPNRIRYDINGNRIE